MANTRSGNVYHIDTQYSTNEELAVKELLVHYVIVTTSAAGGSVVLADGSTTKLTLKVATDEESQVFDFSACPVRFANSIRPTTLSGCVAMVVFSETRK